MTTDPRTVQIRIWAADPYVCISDQIRSHLAYLIARIEALEDVADKARALRSADDLWLDGGLDEFHALVAALTALDGGEAE